MKKVNSKYSQKIKYEIDNLNRLIISKPYSPNSPLRKKTIVEGYFKSDKNKLSYYIESRDKKIKGEIPLHKIVFSGKWSLVKDHNLRFTLNKSLTQIFGNTLELKGEIIKVDTRGLTFRLRKRTTPTKRNIEDIYLSGFWQADSNNRLVLNIRRRKEKDNMGNLIFEGVWSLNKKNQLIYRYERAGLKAKQKAEKTIIFNGYWQPGKRRLTYQLKNCRDSFFSFKASIRTSSLRADKDKIKYEVGIEYKTKRNRKKKIIRQINLFGRWKIRKDLSLDFEMKYPEEKFKALNFGSTWYIKNDKEIAAKLKNKKGEDIGFEVCFTKRFLKDSEFFARISKNSKNKKIETGVRIPF